MASKSSASLVLFLSLNLLFFVFVSANHYKPCPCNPSPTPKPKPPPTPSPTTPTPSPPKPSPTTPTPSPTPSTGGKCPRDALKLGVCANLLGLANIVVGSPATLPCCSLLQGLVDLDVALCLCTAIKANILGINLDVAVTLSLLVNACGYKVPSGFKCT